MDIRVLRYFLTVVREENISKAAQALHVTQPTLSRQMAQLEEELGTPLFVRGKHLTLTDAGVMLRRRAEEVAELMDKIDDEFASREEVGGIISIGSGVLRSSHVLTRELLAFCEKNPRAKYEIYTNTSDYIKEKLDRGLLDFGLLLEPVDTAKLSNAVLLVEEGMGCAFCLDGALAIHSSPRLKFLPICPEHSTRSVLVWKKNRLFSPACSLFIQEINMLRANADRI